MKIPSWPFFEQDEIHKVSEILKSGKVNYWTGQETRFFENEFSKWSNNNYGIALANGSLALSSAYLSLNIGENDEVITTPRTFIATASSLCLLKAKPIFADVDINSGNITAETIEPLINKKTKAISVVHIGGWPAEMKIIKNLAEKYNLSLVEDCAQAHGAKIKDKDKYYSVGSFGDVAAWSFCQDKILTTGGEGGMVTTNKKELFKKIWSIKDHGKSYELTFKNNQSHSFRWLHENFGSNFRLTEMQSAIGRLQLSKLDEWNKIRTRNANILIKHLKDLPNLIVPIPRKGLIHAWYKFNCYLNFDAISSDWNRERIINEIRNEKYPAFSGSCSEIYLEKCFKKNNIFQNKRLKNARKLGETSLMFLLHPTIDINNMEAYSKIIRKVLLKAIR